MRLERHRGDRSDVGVRPDAPIRATHIDNKRLTDTTAEDIMFQPVPRVDRWEPFIAAGVALFVVAAMIVTALSR